MIFPDVEIVRFLHRRVIGIEPTGQRDEDPSARVDLLQSALIAPQNRLHYEGNCRVPILAGILCARIAKNHCFIDGNKRAAVATMLHFLDENGYTVPPEMQDQIYEPLISLLEGSLSEDGFCATIDSLCVVKP